MLETLSRHIASEIKKADPDGPTSVEVMEYAIGIKITEISAVLMVAVIGWITGHFWGALLALATIMFVRRDFQEGYTSATLHFVSSLQRPYV